MNAPPASSTPRYPIPWIASYFIVGLILIVGSIVIAWYLSQFSSDFDYDDPDMRFLERIVLSPDSRSGDFANLNRGDWGALCLVGWNGDTRAAITAASIDAASAGAILAAAEARAEDVRETEFMLVYVTNAGGAKALRHPHGFAFAHSGKAACTTKDKPVLGLPVGS